MGEDEVREVSSSQILQSLGFILHVMRNSSQLGELNGVNEGKYLGPS